MMIQRPGATCRLFPPLSPSLPLLAIASDSSKKSLLLEVFLGFPTTLNIPLQ